MSRDRVQIAYGRFIPKANVISSRVAMLVSKS